MINKKLISLIALVTAFTFLFAGCGKKTPTDKDGNKTESSYQTDSNAQTDVTENTASDTEADSETSGGSNGKYTRPKRSAATYKPIYTDSKINSDDDFTYDIKVTSFNVGGFYHGVDSGMHAEGQFAQWVPGNFTEWMKDLSELETDILAMQEFTPLFYESKNNNISLGSKEVFSNVYKDIQVSTGTTKSDTLKMHMGLAAHKNSAYGLSNINSGYLSASSKEERRAYIKGYVTVKGVKIAVYSVHLSFSNTDIASDSYNELVRMMQKEDYCIVMGDMNSFDIAALMQKAGMNVVNGGKFGKFSTYEYDSSKYIDNIFTTPNIDIVFAECEQNKCGASDHYPLSAYLMVNTDMGSTKNENPYSTDNDGFINGWYKP